MRRWIAGTALAALLTAGGAGVAVAQTASGPSTTNPPAAVPAAPGGQQAKATRPAASRAARKHRRAVRRLLLRGAVRVSAKTIGITPKALAHALRAGESVAQVAEAHHVAPEKVIDALVAAGDARIDRAVADHHLTQKRADVLEKRLPAAAERFVDHHRPARAPKPGSTPVPRG